MWRPGQRPNRGDTADEPTLIGRSQRGDVPAFNCLVELHQQSAYSLALRMLGEPEAAADVTQDAFISAFRAIASFRGTSFRAWLLRIVTNACYDYWRARGRHPSTSLDALLEPDPETEATAGPLPAALIEEQREPERIALRAELVEAIQAALLRLPPEQRLALILSDVQGLAYEEIAQVMQTSLGTVKSRISRARGHMRDLLQTQAELLPAPYRRSEQEE
ncbi:MAG TPA: sigma-70 family RNA polymerase sigma factor [Ktedonobacterales bacterium]|jgi:RNA polymerase sigma-70 factor (ECF subfamily)|nr:sigma-70 family RNA polymerase sigma factor [Ktedonobacterales bacterium]